MDSMERKEAVIRLLAGKTVGVEAVDVVVADVVEEGTESILTEDGREVLLINRYGLKPIKWNDAEIGRVLLVLDRKDRKIIYAAVVLFRGTWGVDDVPNVVHGIFDVMHELVPLLKTEESK